MYPGRFLRQLALLSETAFCSASCLSRSGKSLALLGITEKWISASAVLSQAVIPFLLAQTGEGIAECEVLKWHVKVGDRVEKFDKVCEVQSDKASIEISSPYEGTVASLPHEPGDIVKVGNTLMEVEIDDASAQQSSSSSESPVPPPESDPATKRALAAPTVRFFAKSVGVNISAVTATGPENRVTRDDVLRHVEMNRRVSQHTPNNLQGEGTGDGAINNEILERIPIRGYARGMLKSMTASLSIPHFHFCDDIDMTSLMSMRETIVGDGLLRGEKFPILPFLVKALSTALLEHPIMNSSLSKDQEEIIVHAAHNIGLPVATSEGLVVPVLKNVQQKSVLGMAHEWTQLKKDALCSMLSPEDLSGATITMSNIGSIGSLYSNPLIVPPQAAIVALGKIRTVVGIKGAGTRSPSDVFSHPVLPISWAADHRILDGATAVKFSNRWKQFIEEPGRLGLFLK